ncbi:spermidine synthase [Actinomyces sp. 2119]|uniref:Spermidine synthase n=1 Tax=Actinomyces lilanjuaniae TaxID=2321394 RepID=A0ABN5PR33_9ACTO|nr:MULTISPECIES: fused MFS/spermidine synthase [Actinomyces]AYD90811.1 spermidine synthase [Actinomyces lilanjuaniae]RJF43292.1 spermidine synthase [Actinomyces sp. 2119]
MQTLPSGPVTTSCSTAELVVRDTGVLLLLDGAESSYLDLRDPAHLDFEYHQQMDAVLTVLRGPEAAVRAAHLGGAGCALARAWDAARPGSRQLAVEIDEVLARLVRQWFDLPRSPRLRIRVGDAAEVVDTLDAGSWDVVVRDVFAAGQVPDFCRTEKFLTSCSSALAPGGLLLTNSLSTPRAPLHQELSVLTAIFGGVLVVADAAAARGRRQGNVVTVARRDPYSTREREEIDRAVRRLPLPVRAWDPADLPLTRG